MNKKIFTPFLYFTSVFLVFFAIVFSLHILQNSVGLHNGVFYIGDTDFLFFLLFWGSFIFTISTRVIIAFEEILFPTFTDHIRQCLFLYIVIIAMLVNYVISSVYLSKGVDGALHIIAVATLFIGISVNAVFLFVIHKSKK